MMRKYILPVFLLPAFCFGYTVESPSGTTVVETSVGADGNIRYSVTHEGKRVICDAPLGLITDFADFSKGFSEAGITTRPLDCSYEQDRIKKRNVDVKANRAETLYESADGRRLGLEWHVADNDVAFRYHLPRQKERGAAVVSEELSGFSFPEGTTVFMTSQSAPMVGWKRTKPSYEEYYIVDAPLGTKSENGQGFTFPALFHTPDGVWALVTETGVDGYYCASHLSDFHDNTYSIAYPMPEENNGNGTSSPGIALPGSTPWRTITLGTTPAPVVETTVMYDLVSPRYETGRKARAAKGTWSWILWQDGSINFEDQKRYIDLAAEMGFDNVLIDNWWDTSIGEEKMRELFDYARSRNVRPTLWFSSSGHWNDIEQSPVNRMDRPIVRKQTMRWLRDNGIDAIKVDFFGGDKQETMRLYEDILSDAADYGIDVIFHGCTLPRGWERMYPNFVGAEAVLASENMIFTQDFCDKEALHATLHPFIRNAAAIMEYGGSFLNSRMGKGNDNGNFRRTTDAFQLAVAVLFQNPVQNFAVAPENLNGGSPEEALDFLKSVPTEWDDTRYIDGVPGKYAVVARRSGDVWYVAGVNATDSPLKLNLELPMLAPDASLTLYGDPKGMKKAECGRLSRSGVKMKKGRLPLTLIPESGFVLVSR